MHTQSSFKQSNNLKKFMGINLSKRLFKRTIKINQLYKNDLQNYLETKYFQHALIIDKQMIC